MKQKLGAIMLVLTVLLAACGGGGGGGSGNAASAPISPSGTQNDQALNDSVAYSASPGASLAAATESAALTHHQLVLSGATLNYTATAGHLTAANPANGAPEASFFYVAYTLDNQAPGSRPLMIFYNGGPGSASIWLHMGSFGPRRLEVGAPSLNIPSPVQIVDNAESLLDVTDLVFVDAIGTGYSEAIAPNTNQTFWGVDLDAAAFKDFIVRYLAANQRGSSPLFLFGESYGTTRSPVLAVNLLTAGIKVSGIVSQSSILNYNSNCGMFDPGAVSCAGFVPSYGAVALWDSLVSPVPASLPDYMSTLSSFTANSYTPAENATLTGNASLQAPILNQLALYTGITTGLWQQNFDLGPDLFRTSLLVNELIGRYDGRVTAPTNSALAADGDPSSTLINTPFTSAINSYLPGFLKYSNASTYTLSSDAIDYWDFSQV